MTSTRDRKITIVIQSNLEDVAIVGVAAKELCAGLRIEESVCGDIELSVVEAVNNAVLHAYGNEPGHPVEISFTVRGGRLTIDVCDQGRRMTQDPIPLVAYGCSNRRALPESGMGLMIIEQIMDEVAYRAEKGRNVFSMTRRLDSYPTLPQDDAPGEDHVPQRREYGPR